MSLFVQFTLALAVVIVAAKLCGLIAQRFGQPSVLGELLAGLLLGPTALNFLHLPIFTSPEVLDETVLLLAELGVLFLMFIAGLEVDLGGLLDNRRVSAFTGVLGVLTPLVGGVAVGVVAGFPLPAALFLGITLAATSVSISAQTLLDLGKLRSRVGLALLGAAIIDDILVILVLSIFLALASGGGGPLDVVLVVVRMVAVLALLVLFGMNALPRLTRWANRLPMSAALLTTVMVVTLACAWLSEAVGGVAAITGAFLAGLFFGRTDFRERIEEAMHALAYAFFVPIFFVSIGLRVNARSLGANELLLALGVIAVAVATKLIGGALGARLGGLNWRESVQVGSGMISRGEVGLIVATIGTTAGLISQSTFAVIVIMVLATTLITPPLLNFVFADRPGGGRLPAPTVPVTARHRDAAQEPTAALHE